MEGSKCLDVSCRDVDCEHMDDTLDMVCMCMTVQEHSAVRLSSLVDRVMDFVESVVQGYRMSTINNGRLVIMSR